MASTSTREDPFSSPSSLPPRNYDIFLSFRGEDTRTNFTDHLFAALVRHGFCTYRDGDSVKRGEDIGIELLKAIEESRISVIVFSRNYASSRWCLDELVKIMECKSTFQQMVLPVFYDIDPSYVRAQKGSFAEAFAEHEERYKGRGMEGKLEKWRAALTEASNLSGWDLQNVANGHESKFIEKIVEYISNKLNMAYLNVAPYPVGIESRVEDIIMLLCLGSDDVRMVGIWGIGGLGKTTIAKAVYSLIRHQFEGSSFVANIREISEQPNGLVSLQHLIISDILMNEIQNLRNVDQGIELIKQRVWRRRVLLVLDDVDKFDQLKALAIRRDWFHSGSRIIVTTRDESLLKLLEVDETYMPPLLSESESLQLFSWHAFKTDHPKEDYVELSGKVVGYAGRLPLALEVLGSFLFDKTMPEWKSALRKLEGIPHDAIQEKLRISFDSLNDLEKELFLDIAFFFINMDQKYAIKIMEGCGFFPDIGIAVLSHRCLVRIEAGCLMMHDMLRDMAREVVRVECLKEPGKRSRLCFHEDVLDVLTNHTGTEVVEGLVLNLPPSNDVKVNAQAFVKMNNLRLLKLFNVHLSGSYKHLSKRLKWIYWFGFPLESMPSSLFMEKVVVIEMRYSNLKQVWRGRKILNELKILKLGHSYQLTKTPDFSGCTNLEILELSNCTRLVKVHQSIELLQKLLVLDLENCKSLVKLPRVIWKLTSLQNLCLTGCSKLEKVPGFKAPPSKAWFPFIWSWASAMRNPNSISRSLASVPGLISLKKLSLEHCNLSYVPDELGSLMSLEQLSLTGNNFRTLPASIRLLSQLWILRLNQCTSLQSLPELPVNLKAVDVTFCTSLERTSNGLYSQESLFVILDDCHKLIENEDARNSVKSRKQIISLSMPACVCGCVGTEIFALITPDVIEQGQFVCREFHVIIPRGDVHDVFDYWSEGSVLSFVVPDGMIRGWVLFVFFAHHVVSIQQSGASLSPSLTYEVKNKTKGLNRFNFPPMHRHDEPHCGLELQMESGDEVEFSIFIKGYRTSLVKNCAIKLILEDDLKDFLFKHIDLPRIDRAFC